MMDEEEWASMFDPEILKTPIDKQDMDDLGAELSNALFDTRCLFTRLRHQYGQNTWMSDEVWAAYCLIDQAYDKLQELYESGAIPDCSSNLPPRTPLTSDGVYTDDS